MSTSKHKVAHFVDGKDKFILVQVDAEWAKDYGEKAVLDSLKEHPVLVDHGLPILTAHVDGDDVTYYGAANFADDVAEFGWANIKWEDEEIELEWDDEEEASE